MGSAEYYKRVHSNNKQHNKNTKNTKKGMSSIKKANSFVSNAMNKNKASNGLSEYTANGSIMTSAEKKFFKKLEKALNERLRCINRWIYVFPCVRLADFMSPNKLILKDYNKSYTDLLYQITSKHVDFLICDSFNFNIVCAVELDDYTHNNSDRKERDIFINKIFSDCGIKLFRISEKIDNINDGTLGDIIDFIMIKYAPICPLCNAPTVMHKSNKQFNLGHRFYGCSRWISKGKGCQFSLDIE